MPRLSLYKPEKGKDYEFLDRQILEMFTVGGTDILIHKYVGTDDGTTVKDETQIQDVIFGENRDRRYEPDIYTHRAIYNVQDLDFNLSQFGLFLTNDTLFMTIHIRSSVKTLGRKIMSGDVIELPHLKDEYALNDYSMALKRFYVVEEVTRAAEGFSQTWYPHLYRLKLKQIYDGQEYKDILDLPADEESPGGPKLRDFLSTYEREMQINDAILEEAISETQQSGYDTNHFFTLQTSSDLVTVTTNIPITVSKGDIVIQGDTQGEVVSSFSDTLEFQIKNVTGKFSRGEFHLLNKVLPINLELNFDLDETSVRNDSGLAITVGDTISQLVNEYIPAAQGEVVGLSLSKNSKTTLTIIPSNNTLFKIVSVNDQLDEGKVLVNNEIARYVSDDSVEYFVEIRNVDNTKLTLITDSGNLKTELIKTESTLEMAKPDIPGYQGYLIGEAAPNGEAFGHGLAFPTPAVDGSYFLRTDFLPNRLFKYKNGRWNKVQDLRRADMIGADTANNQKGNFINNSSTSTVAGETFDQRQALSKALRPKADN
jgi:hypothetical protein